MEKLRRLKVKVKRLIKDIKSPYKPEKHYMRGHGPASKRRGLPQRNHQSSLQATMH